MTEELKSEEENKFIPPGIMPDLFYNPLNVSGPKSLHDIGVMFDCDKANHNYLDIYEQHIKHMRYDPINLLEFGFHSGRSFLMWRDYFPAATLLMCDIQYDSRVVSYCRSTRQNFTLFQGDQSDPGFADTMTNWLQDNHQGLLDIVIDDASHLQYDMIKSLALFYPHMKSGGVYIIEDVVPAQDLENGAKWWGSPDESSDEDFCNNPGMEKVVLQDKPWLPNGKKDTYYCLETTALRHRETGIFESAFLTEEENNYITQFTKDVHIYEANKGPLLNCSSSVVIFTKK
tara:strand:+ start:284 stop:1144 length:861 start_codon:yes stop_codon:yes gene_type:complete